MTAKLSASTKAILFIILIAATPWSAWVLATLWRWFLVPLGAPHVTALQAWGANLVFSMARTHWTPDDVWDRFGEKVWHAYLAPAIFLLGGWLGHLIAVWP